MPIIIPGNRLASTGHTISQSIRFNDDDSPYMQRTFGTPTDAKKWTLSAWVKLHGITDGATGGVRLLDVGSPAGSEDLLSIGSGYAGYSKIYFWSRTSSSYDWRLETSAEYRDPSAWMHLTFVFDSDNTLSVERMRLFVNGERITNFSQESYPSSGDASRINTAVAHRIGTPIYSSSNYSNGYAAEMVFIDGQALTCDSFGEFNSSGIWIPKDISGLTFGNNGYHIDGRDASDLGDDESGNGNDFTTSGLGAHDQVLDSPTNNFCTANPLDGYYFAGTFKDGNLDVTTSGATGNYTFHTTTQKIPTSGKWYIEVRAYEIGAGCYIGITQEPTTAINVYLGQLSTTWGYNSGGNLYTNNSGSSYGNSYTNGDIIGIAVDMDNNKLYFSKNGTFQNSGDPTSGSTGTGAISITGGVDYFLGASDDTGAATTSRFMWNFGQDGTFNNGVTAQGNKDASGIGNFYYSVPSGYKALCTKNLGS